jgi:hypothetical protein
MVSEYANGKYAWVLSLMFFLWGGRFMGVGICTLPASANHNGKDRHDFSRPGRNWRSHGSCI